MTRPDIANIVRWLSRFVTCYHELHVKFVRRLLGYLRGTKGLGIVYHRGSGDCEISCYSDSSYGDDYFTGRSTVAFVTMMSGGPIGWKSMLTKFVCDSSTKSEYAAMSEAVVSIEHLRHIKDDILGCSSNAVNIHSKGMEAVGDVKNACVT